MEAPVRIENGLRLRGTIRKKKSCDEVLAFEVMNGVLNDKDGASAAKNQTSVVAEGVFGDSREVGLSLDSRRPKDDMQASTSKSERLRECVEQSVSEDSKKKVSGILMEVQQLSDVEKLLLYLQLPTGAPPTVDPLKQKSPGNPLGKKADMEVAQTYTWIQSHLEEDSEVSLPKQEVYDEYRLFCQANKIEALCAADFGKVMKYIFPSVKPRRLGTRGNSRYCYSGLRKRLLVDSPVLPDLTEVPDALQDKVLGGSSCMGSTIGISDETFLASCHLIFEWAEKLLNKRFSHLQDLAYHLLENTYVDTRSVAAFTLLSSPAPSQSLTTSVHNGQGNPLKGNQGNAILKSVGNGNKRRETQLQLQRKLLEKGLIKEQKKKMQEQRITSFKGSKSQRRSCKKESTQQQQHASDKSKDDSISDTAVGSFCGTVKIEDSDDLKESDLALNTCPQKLLRCQSENGITSEVDRKAKKVPIMRKSSSPAVCFQQGTLSSIIIFPTIPSQVQITPSDVGSRSPTKLISQPKYKRIQPKPASTAAVKPLSTLCSPVHSNEGLVSEIPSYVNRSFTESPQNFTSSLSQSDELPNRADTVNGRTTIMSSPSASADIQMNKINASLFDSSIAGAELAASFENAKAASVIVDMSPQLHSKRQADEPEAAGVAKKLHLDDTQSDLTQSSSPDGVPTICPKLEPVVQDRSVSNQEETFNLQFCNNRTDEKNEMSIHDLESDALMEFLQGGNQTPPNVAFTSAEVHNSSRPVRAFKQVGKPCTELSQLRLLLERNLPHNTANKLLGSLKQQPSGLEPSGDALTVETYELSELKQVLLRDNRQSFRSKSEPSSDRIPWLPDASLTSEISDIVNPVENPSLEKTSLTSSPHLDNALSLDGSLCSVTNLPSQSGLNQTTSDVNHSSFPSSEMQQRPVDNVQCTSICTQIPSVPPSPNTRRRAFNFMPISPGQTPNPSDSHLSTMSPIPPQFLTNNPMLSSTINTGSSAVSIAVGPSQPPSAASSPFVSPRGTPIPVVRSRHNSGQSIHRQTPCQTTDSGVSSISTSPFVSPQTTPIPVSRLRHNSNHSGSVGKTVTFSTTGPQVSMSGNPSFQCRSRHSSGPLTPSASLSQGFLSRTPMSPLVGENYTQTSFSENPSQRSRHNSASSQPPVSPHSNPVSPLALNSDAIGSDTGSVYSLKQSPHVQWSSGSWNTNRSRHMSGSVIHHKPSQASHFVQSLETAPQGPLGDSSLSLEIQNLLQGPPIPLDTSARSRSVPLHQMLRNMIDQCANSQDDNLSGSENMLTVSRSYPATPLNDTPFHLPAVGGRSLLDDHGLGSLKCPQPDWVSLDMLNPSSRRNLSDLLEQPPISDDLQTTLEDLRDCDNDYSKFALELDQDQESNYS